MKKKKKKNDAQDKKEFGKSLEKTARQEAPSTRRKSHKRRVVHAKNPEKSYIYKCHESYQKLHPVVQDSRMRTLKYKQAIGGIKTRLEDDHLSKEEASALRNSLC